MQEFSFDVNQFANDLRDEWLDNVLTRVDSQKKTSSCCSSSNFNSLSQDKQSTIEQPPKKKRRPEKVYAKTNKRKDKLNEKLEELKELLPFLGNAALKKKKMTKETVLLDTIEYIQLLKSTATKTFRIADEDPFAMKLTQPEITAGFNVMFKTINQGLFSVCNLATLNSMAEETNKLIDIATMSDNVEHLLLAYTTKIILSSSIAYIPLKVAEFCEKALPIFNSLQPSRQKSLLSMFGANIGCVILVIYAVALGRMGHFDRSTEQYQRALKLAQTLNHPPSLQCIYSTTQQYKGTRGEYITIEESSTMIKNLGSNIWWKPFGDLALASSVAEFSTEKAEAHKLLVDAIDQVIAKFGSLTELTVRISALKTWKKVDINTGIMHATSLLAQVEKTGITGAWTRADLLTRTVELLLWKKEENPVVRELTELECKSMLSVAYKEAYGAGSGAAAIGALLMLLKLEASRGEWKEYNLTIQSLANITAKVQRNSVKERPALLVEATSILERHSTVL